MTIPDREKVGVSLHSAIETPLWNFEVEVIVVSVPRLEVSAPSIAKPIAVSWDAKIQSGPMTKQHVEAIVPPEDIWAGLRLVRI